MKKIIACMLSVMMLLSCSVIYADEAVIEEVTTEEVAGEDAAQAVPEETEKVIPRVIGTFEEKNGDRTIFYVATNGKDSNSGTIDAPFATITKARDVIRSMKKAGTLGSGGAVVYVRGGTYVLTEGIVFTEEDSGTKDAPIIYRSYPEEDVEFLGGASIPWDAFEKVTDEKILERVVEKSIRGEIVAANLKSLGFKEFPEQSWPGPYSYWKQTIGEYLKENGITEPQGIAPELIINGHAMTLARYPNDDYMEIAEVIEEGTNTEPFTPFTIGVNDNRVRNWTQAKDAILTGTWQYSWGQSSTVLGNVNTSNNRITAKYATHHKATLGQLFHVYNLLEEIDIPGEYYLDRSTGMMYLLPPDEDVEEIIYTMLNDTMFTFKGASYITLKGIDMKYMRYNAFNFDGNSSNNTLQDCEITYTGKTSNMVGKNNLIVDCWFHDVEGGVSVSGGDSATLTHANNVVENSVFERSDRLTKTYCDAIVIGGVGNIARHNYMAEAQHLLARMSGQENTYEFNEFANACTNTDDMGALYTGRNLTHRGNKIQYNYFHDVGGANRGGNGVHGIFLDDWWSAADVVGNVFADITGAGCMAAGRHNVFSNNIFINCSESLRLTRSFDYGNPTNFQTYIDGVNNAPYVYNELWLSKYPDMKDVINEDGQPDMDSNIVATNNVLFNSADVATSEQIAKTATVEGNVSFSKDPGFYDLLNKNYLLKPDSEVYNRIPEFIEIPFTRIGTYSDRALARIKKAYVYCLESPYVYKNGELIKEDKNNAIVENGAVYLPLRSGAEAIGATVDFNEDTHEVTVATGAKALTFTSGGELSAVKVNGSDYTLEKPVINKSYTNYIALTDLVNIFEKHLVQKGSISVISGIEGLFTEEADDGLLRYIESQLSVY